MNSKSEVLRGLEEGKREMMNRLERKKKATGMRDHCTVASSISGSRPAGRFIIGLVFTQHCTGVSGVQPVPLILCCCSIRFYFHRRRDDQNRTCALSVCVLHTGAAIGSIKITAEQKRSEKLGQAGEALNSERLRCVAGAGRFVVVVVVANVSRNRIFIGQN